MIEKLCYNFFAWRKYPHELIRRATYSNHPDKFGSQKHRKSEVTLFFGRLGLRPLTMYCIRKVYKDTGFTPVGFGFFTVALRSGEEVIKIYEFSTKCTEAERDTLLGSLQERLKIANKYIDGLMLPTTVNIKKHPVFGTDCVVLSQPYFEGKPLAGSSYSKGLNEPQRKALYELFYKSKTMIQETGYCADVNGHNIYVNGDEVRLVDTVLAGKVDLKIRKTTLRILEREIKNLETSFS